jgi:predicted amidohydrolase
MSSPNRRVVIALGQFDVALGQPEHNLETVRGLAADATRQAADILVLPELWSTGYDLARAERYAAAIDQGIFAETAALAREFGLFIAGSCLSTLGEGRIGNTAVLFGPDGRQLANYSKIHLFRLMDEDRYLSAGDRLVAADSPLGKIGLAICYDLRFPELFRPYALAGVEMVLLPAEWPHPRLVHWRTLLRARAIENQLFMVACNRVGIDSSGHFFGHSVIVDPWGELVIEGDEGEALLTAMIDLEIVVQARQKISALTDRRPDAYGLL